MKKYFKIALLFLSMIVFFVIVDAAAFSNYYGKQTVRLYNELKLYSTTGVQKFAVDNSGNVAVAGNLTVSGATVTGITITADTSSFTTTSFVKAIYISGALSTDKYFISKRLAIATASTSPSVDSLSYSYIAKTDSLIVVRPNSNLVSGAKFSYLRVY